MAKRSWRNFDYILLVALLTLSAFGVDCTDAAHPYLYWDNNLSTDRSPIARNMRTRRAPSSTITLPPDVPTAKSLPLPRAPAVTGPSWSA